LSWTNRINFNSHYPEKEMAVHLVRKLVNNPRFDDPPFIEPAN
jgi:hypothetical protein